MLSEKAHILFKCNLQSTPVTLYGGHLKDILEQEGSGCAFVYLRVCVEGICVSTVVWLSVYVCL